MSPASRATSELLAGLSAGTAGTLEEVLTGGGARPGAIGLGPRTAALTRIAALIALDGPPAAYAVQVAGAIEAGATAEDIVDVLRAVAPDVGGSRVVAAAPEIMLALGLPLPELPDGEPESLR